MKGIDKHLFVKVVPGPYIRNTYALVIAAHRAVCFT